MFADQAKQENLLNNGSSDSAPNSRHFVDREQDRHKNVMNRLDNDIGSLEHRVEALRQKVVNGERKLRMSEVEAFTDMLTDIGKSAAALKSI